MSNNPVPAKNILDQLEGIWQGQGRGGYPTIESFDYRETLVFTRKNDITLAYDQRTEKRMSEKDEYIKSHWENGFISILENGNLELVNAQSGGRGEMLTGKIEMVDSIICLRFTSKAFMNDARMFSTTRTFELEGDQLRYEMKMSTTKVADLSRHLIISLERT